MGVFVSSTDLGRQQVKHMGDLLIEGVFVYVQDNSMSCSQYPSTVMCQRLQWGPLFDRRGRSLTFAGQEPKSRVEKQGKRGERPCSDEDCVGLGLAGQDARDPGRWGAHRELIKASAKVNRDWPLNGSHVPVLKHKWMSLCKQFILVFLNCWVLGSLNHSIFHCVYKNI